MIQEIYSEMLQHVRYLREQGTSVVDAIATVWAGSDHDHDTEGVMGVFTNMVLQECGMSQGETSQSQTSYFCPSSVTSSKEINITNKNEQVFLKNKNDRDDSHLCMAKTSIENVQARTEPAIKETGNHLLLKPILNSNKNQLTSEHKEYKQFDDSKRSSIFHNPLSRDSNEKDLSVRFSTDNKIYDENVKAWDQQYDSHDEFDSNVAECEFPLNKSCSQYEYNTDEDKEKRTEELNAKLRQKLETMRHMHVSDSFDTTIASKLDELQDVTRKGGSLNALQVIAEDVHALQRSIEKEFEYQEQEHRWKEKVRHQLLRDIEAVIRSKCMDSSIEKFISSLYTSISNLRTNELSPRQMKDVVAGVMKGLEKVQCVQFKKLSEQINSSGTFHSNETKNNEGKPQHSTDLPKHDDLNKDHVEDTSGKTNSNDGDVPLELLVVRTVQCLNLFLELFPQHACIDIILNMKDLLQYTYEKLGEEVEKFISDINLSLIKLIENYEKQILEKNKQ
jgi:hypothetical protein